MRTILLIVLCAGTVFGQAPATQSTFEVASVKPSPPDAPGMFIRPLPGGSLRVSGASLRNLISLAYERAPVSNFQFAASGSTRNDTISTHAPPPPMPTLQRIRQNPVRIGARYSKVSRAFWRTVSS